MFEQRLSSGSIKVLDKDLGDIQRRFPAREVADAQQDDPLE